MNTQSKMPVGNVARALASAWRLSPLMAPCEIQRPPLQPFPTSRKASRIHGSNLQPSGIWHRDNEQRSNLRLTAASTASIFPRLSFVCTLLQQWHRNAAFSRANLYAL